MKNVNQRLVIIEELIQVLDILDHILKREKKMNKRVTKLEKKIATK